MRDSYAVFCSMSALVWCRRRYISGLVSNGWRMKGIAFAAWIATILTGCSAFELDCSKGPMTFEKPVMECVRGMCAHWVEYVTYCNQPPQEPEQIQLD